MSNPFAGVGGKAMQDNRWIVRPILAIMSLFALILFYILKTVGYEIPVEVNGFWAPVSYWFVSRSIEKAKDAAASS